MGVPIIIINTPNQTHMNTSTISKGRKMSADFTPSLGLEVFSIFLFSLVLIFMFYVVLVAFVGHGDTYKHCYKKCQA